MTEDPAKYSANLCDICGKNPATIHFTQIVDGVVTKMHLCADCAKKKGIFLDEFSAPPFDILGKFLSALALPQKEYRDITCPNCGKRLSEFKKDGKLGCSECWSAFRNDLIPLLEKIHGIKIRSRSRSAKKTSQVQSEIKRLQELLDEAELRDEIKQIRGEGKNRKEK